MIYEYMMYAGYASIIASVAMTVVSAFDIDLQRRRKPVVARSVTLKQIGQLTLLQGVTTYSNVEDNV